MYNFAIKWNKDSKLSRSDSDSVKACKFCVIETSKKTTAQSRAVCKHVLLAAKADKSQSQDTMSKLLFCLKKFLLKSTNNHNGL